MSKHFHSFESFLNESINVKGDDFLLLVYKKNPRPNTPPTYIYASNSEEKFREFPKGELADMIEKDFNVKIPDASELETEVISYKDFMDDYGSQENPNRLSLSNYNIKRI